ncbi:MAG: TonB-dependent receptor [Lewinellaceae bacterium]|nr:TonB-dependent receptor [Saprospiraceae bacterium]MCB9353692.1 TonB-dependent receptor [Lewinellaceae bacterium]
MILPEKALLRTAILLLGVSTLSAAAQAQRDSAILLPGAEVRSARFDQTGFAVWRADSLPIPAMLNLSDRLLWENPLSVRANAPGALATISARGTGPSRTPVFWNGLNIQSPQNGVVDAALLPLWPDDRLEVRYGGQSAAQSSGAMGAVVMVDPVYDLDEGFSGAAGAAMGSFGRRDLQASLGYAGGGLDAQIRAGWQQADNDFPFVNTARIGQPEMRQPNNELEKLDIQQLNRLIIGSRDIVKTAVWHQRAFREIPPAMTESPSETWQRDRATRLVAGWEHSRNARSLLHTHVAYIDEAIYFRFAGRVDSSRARTALVRTEYARRVGRRFNWKAGASAIQQWAQADGYADTSRWYHQTRLGTFGMGEWHWPGGSVTALLRQEWVEKEAVPFTWSLGGRLDIGRAGSLRLHLSRNFNLPTFNDRFWLSYGQSELRPEKGYSADAGWIFQHGDFSVEAAAFQSLIDDWILWQPGADGIFRPGNLRKVWSRGLEAAVHCKKDIKRWRLAFSGRYQYVKATNAAVYGGSEASLHKQLTYTPNHRAGVTVKLIRGRFQGAYLHQWTGKRYVTTDNSDVLQGFMTGNFLAQYDFPILRSTSLAGSKAKSGSKRLVVYVRLENLWDQAYQVIAFRPMPGRNWLLGVRYVW